MSASIRREVIIRLCARFFENKTLAQRSESFIKKPLLALVLGAPSENSEWLLLTVRCITIVDISRNFKKYAKKTYKF